MSNFYVLCKNKEIKKQQTTIGKAHSYKRLRKSIIADTVNSKSRYFVLTTNQQFYF